MSLGHHGPKPPAPIRYDALNVGSSLMDLPVTIIWGQRRLTTNAIWYGDFKHHSVSGKGKGGGVKGQKAYDYTAATIQALGEGPFDSIARAWAAGSTTTTSTLSQLNMTFFSGTAAQAPWSWIVSNYPAQARAYAYTAYLACPKQDLGESATIPDNAFECVRSNGFAYTHTTAGWINPSDHVQHSAIDVLLSDCANDLLVNVQYGALMAPADIGDMTQWATYMRAQGLFYSPKLDRLEKATSVLNRWAQLSNSWIYWSGTQLQFVPLGDSALTGNGVTYSPQDDAAYSLSLNDFLFESGEPPVKVSRKDPADCPNRTILNITDRTIGYTSNPLEYKDQTLVDTYGLRDNANVQGDEICDPPVGKIVVALLGQRAAYLRNTYTFKTSYRFIRCLPGTILTLTEPNIGLNQIRVRVLKIEEDENLRLAFTCEEFPGNVGSFVTTQVGVSGNVTTYPNEFADPGVVNTPAVIEPNSAFSSNPKLLIAASGGAQWGGCEVNISFDGSSYQYIGRITSPASQGTLTSALPSHADPDTTDTLAVDCTESLAVPLAVTTADADNFRSLALIAPQPTIVGGVAALPPGELLAFGDVTATGTYTAHLTYLRRGAYGTAPAAHSVGDQFTVVDTLGQTGTTLAYELPPQYVGQTVYLKLASFNVFGNALEDLSTVQEYSYSPKGTGYGTQTAGAPATPTGLTVTGGLNSAAVSWSANPATDNVTTYSLYRAAGSGASFGSAVEVWQGKTLNAVDQTVPSTGAYTWFVVANNAIGSSGPTAGVSATVTLSGVLAPLNQVGSGQIAAGTLLGNAVRLKVVCNNTGSISGGAGEANISVTADLMPLFDAAHHMIVAAGVSVTAAANASPGLGGPDTAATKSAMTASPYPWGYIYVVSDGTNFGCVVSSSSTAPTLPSGYTYYFRVGACAFYPASSGAALYPTNQLGQVAGYVNIGSGVIPPIAFQGSTTGGGWNSEQVRGDGYPIPETATHFKGIAATNGGKIMYAAPNANWGTTGSLTNPPYVSATYNNVTANVFEPFEVFLESDDIQVISNYGSGTLFCTGWIDNVAA